ncbi:glutamate synthase-related protein [Ectothiorhodospira mobilis]|uniref:glutamate synthase-related protein n=1 Tax=Ectothiorhodospira mobilis TaxID=195064 RepID=UPI00190764C1|nr:glutamate synthase-related protein [Ectothiorhodospira mobilis]
MSDWQTVCEATELKEDRGHEVWVNGRPLALFLHQGRVHALDDRCPHLEGQLSEGRVVGGDAVCPLHGWNFDLETGISPYHPGDRIDTYPARLKDGRVEVDAAAVPPLPAATFEGYQGRWRRWSGDTRGKAEIRRLAMGKGPALAPMGAPAESPGPVPGFDHFHLAAAQLEPMPRLDGEPADTRVILGSGAGAPLHLALPVTISHMSFGALSREAKIALAEGAARAGTLIGSGEGGMLPEERAAAGLYVLEMASGYFGWNEESMARADAFEIKLGQSAKPGLGGELPATKVTEEIARVRGIRAGEAARAPARFPDLEDARALGERITALRRDHPTKPVGLKIAANRLEADLEAALALEPDFITVDGFGGGTGGAPVHVRDHFGMPLVMALPLARRRVDAHNALSERPVTLVATGGIRTPADILKALALGADACALATAALFALGCEYYRACHTGRCPTGVATQTPRLRARVDPAVAAERVARFLDGTRAILEDYLRVTGHAGIGALSRDDLIPLTPAARDLLEAG